MPRDLNGREAVKLVTLIADTSTKMRLRMKRSHPQCLGCAVRSSSIIMVASMGEFLLSVAWLEFLSWIGFVILALGLLGEVGLYVIPPRWEVLHGASVFIFAAVVLAGYLINHIGDEAITARIEARATAAENELNALKAPRYPLTNEQRDRLAKVLDAVPINERFEVIVLWPQINGVQRYANEVQQVFSIRKMGRKGCRRQPNFRPRDSHFGNEPGGVRRQNKAPSGSSEADELLRSGGIHYTMGPWTNIIVPYAFIVGAE